jgi:hypothetical protein
MEVTTEVTTADYKSFLIDYYFYQGNAKSWLKLIAGAAATVFLLLLYLNSWPGWPITLIFFTASLLSLYCVFVIIPFGIKALKFNKSATRLLFLNKKVNITAYAPGISVENDSGNNFFNWEQIKRIVASSKYICVYLTSKKILLIPKSDFKNSESARLFLYKIDNGWQNTKPPTQPFQEPGSPSYFWGLIGLVPIIGAVNGVIMILMGVIQYKDYKYCFIGLMGILFTFVFFKYVDIFPSPPNMNSPAMVKTLKEWTQEDLNQLVKNIEFYKYEHNSYPDSLQQLKDDNKTVSIYDPIIEYRHLKGDKVNTVFNYKKINNKYTLFSSGLDEKPHTKDDIYPIIKVTDTSKFGLIKE